ncbi:MAG: hypothetical protein ACI8UO_004681 [Verrucomicrobiales bacterium]
MNQRHSGLNHASSPAWREFTGLRRDSSDLRNDFSSLRNDLSSLRDHDSRLRGTTTGLNWLRAPLISCNSRVKTHAITLKSPQSWQFMGLLRFWCGETVSSKRLKINGLRIRLRKTPILFDLFAFFARHKLTVWGRLVSAPFTRLTIWAFCGNNEHNQEIV